MPDEFERACYVARAANVSQTDIKISHPIPAHIAQLMHSAKIQGRGEEYRIAGPLAASRAASAGLLNASALVAQVRRY
jgi:hypothetical protein